MGFSFRKRKRRGSRVRFNIGKRGFLLSGKAGPFFLRSRGRTRVKLGRSGLRRKRRF